MIERRFYFTKHLRERFVERIGIHGQQVRKNQIEKYVERHHRKISGIIKRQINNADGYFYFDREDDNPQRIFNLFKKYKDAVRFEFFYHKKSIFVNAKWKDGKECVVTCYDDKEDMGVFLNAYRRNPNLF